jgi:hypothetical protein
MSARGFGSLVMASSVAAAALGCYLVSLKVASERAKLERVEAQIVMAERDIRVLETEIGTRGRLAQLERWNANFIRLSAPSADQILEGGFQLATMIRPPERHAVEAPVVLASAPRPQENGEPVLRDDAGEEIAAVQPAAPKVARPDQMMHVANYKVPDKAAVPPRKAPVATASEKAVKPDSKTPATTSSRKVATADPLAPLSAPKPAATAPTSKPSKESSKSQ